MENLENSKNQSVSIKERALEIKEKTDAVKKKAGAAKAKADAFSAKVKKKEPKIFGEFRTFINHGNVVDLAVGVVIGSAFTKITSSLVNDIIMPLIGMLIGGVDFSGLVITVPNWLGGNDAAVLHYGLFIQNVVDFLIVAASIFIVVKIFNGLTRKKDEDKAKEVEKADAEIIALLTDIKSELKKRN